MTKKPFYKSLYFQVLLAITLGVLLGHFYPDISVQMKPLGDGFVKLIKMIIAPVIFCTVVTGIAGMESMKAVGRTGAIALLGVILLPLLHKVKQLDGDKNTEGNSRYAGYHRHLLNR